MFVKVSNYVCYSLNMMNMYFKICNFSICEYFWYPCYF